MFGDAFRGKTAWVSGHTGFKGSWLCQWLLELGARVHGFSLPPPTDPSLFVQLGLEKRLRHEIGDVRDAEAVRRSIAAARPDFVFHLAAQPLVRLSYEQPVETYATNVMGTVHVLEALRRLEHPCAAVLVTTDKCYENRETLYEYHEGDQLGGHDPYSSSKAAAEIVISAYRRSYFTGQPVKVASARAGNVIGGGDWALDRIVPDCVRALAANRPIQVRNRKATRPWQHVLEPLGGYLWLAALLANPGLSGQEPKPLADAFNFGPTSDSNRTVGELVQEILKHWPGTWEDHTNPNAVHEATLLQLSIKKAAELLGWSPVWDFSTTIAQTVQWYRSAHENGEPAAVRELTVGQIENYSRAARDMAKPWALA